MTSAAPKLAVLHFRGSLALSRDFIWVYRGFNEQISVSLCRLEQEKSALQKRAKARPVTADQVVAAQTSEMENEIEELREKNSELEAQICTIK